MDTEVPKFQVGDRVRIRSWDDMEDEFGIYEDPDDPEVGIIKVPNGFPLAMQPLCGRTATILEFYWLDGIFEYILTDWSDSSGDLEWNFSEGMLEKGEH